MDMAKAAGFVRKIANHSGRLARNFYTVSVYNYFFVTYSEVPSQTAIRVAHPTSPDLHQLSP